MLANHPRSISLRKSQMFLHFKIITRHSVVIPRRWYHRNIQTARHEYVRQKDIRKTEFVDIFLNHICSSPYPTLHGHLTAFEAIRTSSSHNRQDASSLAIPDGSTTLKFSISPWGMTSSNCLQTSPVVSIRQREATLDLHFSCLCAELHPYGSSQSAEVVLQSGKAKHT